MPTLARPAMNLTFRLAALPERSRVAIRPEERVLLSRTPDSLCRVDVRMK
jgi:hypothetical protein